MYNINTFFIHILRQRSSILKLLLGFFGYLCKIRTFIDIPLRIDIKKKIKCNNGVLIILFVETKPIILIKDGNLKFMFIYIYLLKIVD